MKLAAISLVLFSLIFFMIYYSALKPALNANAAIRKANSKTFIVLLAFAFLIRIVVSLTISGFPTDINCFKHWADSVYEGGMKNFYFSGSFADYPPGYMYVLYIIGFLKNVFHIPFDSNAFLLMIKMPAVLCDIAGAYLIYHFAGKSEKSKPFALPLSAIYALNPAVIINSSAWGQVDSVYTLFVVLFICLLYSEKYILSCLVFALGFMIKPQGIIFAPVLLCYFLYKIIFTDETKKLLKETAIAAAACIFVMFLIALPFAKNFNFYPIIKQYISTISSYPYATVNAYNLNFIAGGNWADIKSSFLFLSFDAWSVIFIALTVFIAIYAFLKSEGKKSYFELGAFIIISVFTLASKMHERYVFPAILLLLFAFIKNQDMRYIKLYFALSITQILNASIVLYRAMILDTTSHPEGMLPYVLAAANIGILIYMIWILFSDKRKAFPQKDAVTREKKIYSLPQSSKRKHLSRIDFIFMAIVTLVYCVVSFVSLGDTKAAKTHLYIENQTTLKFTLDSKASALRYYSGYINSGNFDVYTDGDYFTTVDTDGVFAWHDVDISADENVELYFFSDFDAIEMAFLDEDGNCISYSVEGKTSFSDKEIDVSPLNDEQNLVPKAISYKNSAYFDEVYHARTAYEFIHGLTPYENTHPPLGKVIISLGVMIFGMCPFGWRFPGTLFGILMLPAIYIFAREMFKKRRTAMLSMLLFAADFMHFVQTRIATIDVFIVFFTILMFFFMYRYTKLSFYDTPLLKTFIPLGLSGICFGLAVASKWSGLYGGVGLCIIFFASIGKRIYEYHKIMNTKSSSAEDRNKVKKIKSKILLTLLFCIGAFVVVPIGIYALSYIPYLRAPNMNGIKSILENQASMLSYHGNLDSTHPFSSEWYEWPLIIRPMWYYTNNISDLYKQSIAAMGNPAVWWSGIAALIYLLVNLRTKKVFNKNSLFIFIAFLSNFLPWVGISRCIFIYHYFPCVPFLILAICNMYETMSCRADNAFEIRGRFFSKTDVLFFILAMLSVILFMAFYPVLSAATASQEYIDSLKWFTTWVF